MPIGEDRGVKGWRWVVALGTLALVAAACGSTVKPAAQQTAGPELGDRAQLEATENGERGVLTDATASTDTPEVSAATGVGAANDGTTDADAARRSALANGGSAAAGPTGRPMGPGITDKKITIGIGWFDINAYIAVLAPSAERRSGTTKDAADAVVKWINSHGGIAGRQIEPIYHEYPLHDVVGSNDTRDRREQAMCADFTEDHQAFAAIPWIASQGVFYQCAAQHNLITISVSFSEGMVDRTMYGEIGQVWYMPHSFLVDRREEMFVAQLNRRGFFARDAKVGLILADSPPTRRGAERSLEPALEALGVNVVERAYYDELHDNWQNMVLRFRTAGVTHVIWGSSACSFLCSSQFMTASENQGYRPYNAIGSDHGAPLAIHALVTPKAQRERIVAVSWSTLDLGADRYEPAKPINEADATCRRIKRESGSEVDQIFFATYCEGLFFIRDNLEAAPELTADGFRQAAEALGPAYPPITTWSATFGPARHDGASAVRDFVYEAACECFQYSGPVRSVG